MLTENESRQNAYYTELSKWVCWRKQSLQEKHMETALPSPVFLTVSGASTPLHPGVKQLRTVFSCWTKLSSCFSSRKHTLLEIGMIGKLSLILFWGGGGWNVQWSLLITFRHKKLSSIVTDISPSFSSEFPPHSGVSGFPNTSCSVQDDVQSDSLQFNKAKQWKSSQESWVASQDDHAEYITHSVHKPVQ